MMVGDNTIVGVNVAAEVTVFVGVNVATGVSVKLSLVVGVTCSSVEGAQAETNRKIIKAIRDIFN